MDAEMREKFEGAVQFHVSGIHRYAQLFEHEIGRIAPNKTMLNHYMDSMQAEMRMCANAALVLAGERL